MGHAKKESTPSVVADTRLNPSAPKSFFWFIAKGEVLKGPFSTHELKKLIERGEVSSKFYAWRDGFREWRPLGGVSEFDSVQADGEVFAFPSVPIPGQLPQNSVPRLQPAQRAENIPVFKIRLSHSRFSQLKKSEIVMFFIITLFFSLGLVQYSFSAFEKQWDLLWGRRVSGMVLHVGTQTDTAPMFVFEPLLSAPGLATLDEQWVPVEMEGNLDRRKPSVVNSFQIKSAGLGPEEMENMNWDTAGVFTRRVHLQGLVDLKNPSNFIIEHAGLPFEPILSKRRSHP